MSDPADRQSDQRDEALPEPEGEMFTDDLEAPTPDALDQARTVVSVQRWDRTALRPDVPEADALDQAREVPLDEDVDGYDGAFPGEATGGGSRYEE